MVRVSVLNDCLVRLFILKHIMDRSKVHRTCFLTPSLQNNIVNAERRGKRQVLIRPSSKVVVKVLTVMQKHGELSPT